MSDSYRAIVTVVDPWGQSHTAGGETVYESEPGPINTGLVNAQGIRIFRFPEKIPLGFDLSRGKNE